MSDEITTDPDVAARRRRFDFEWNQQFGDHSIVSWTSDDGEVAQRVYVASPTLLRYAVIRQRAESEHFPTGLEMTSYDIIGREDAKRAADSQAARTGDLHSVVAYVKTDNPFQADPASDLPMRQQQNQHIVNNARALRRRLLGAVAADAHDVWVNERH